MAPYPFCCSPKVYAFGVGDGLTQIFNRLVTVTGYGIASAPRLRRWEFPTYDVDITESDRTVFGQWGAWKVANGVRTALAVPANAGDLEDAAILRFDSRLSDDPADLLPELDVLLVSTYPNARPFILGQTDRHFVSFDVGNVVATVLSIQDQTLLFYDM